jgi:CheY-like chemotaxis protein
MAMAQSPGWRPDRSPQLTNPKARTSQVAHANRASTPSNDALHSAVAWRHGRKPEPGANPGAGADAYRSAAGTPPGPTALLIGGDPAQQRFCQTFLQTLDVTVEVARNFQDGMHALAASSFGLVIVDARTRGFDAGLWSCVLTAKAARGGPAAKIYFVTDDSRMPNAQIAGTWDCLCRPVRALDLVRVVERLRFG